MGDSRREEQSRREKEVEMTDRKGEGERDLCL